MCWKCKKNIQIENIAFKDECSICKSDLHCCKNCKFYAPGFHYDCHEDIDELVKDKEKANFCDSFVVKRIFDSQGNDLSFEEKNQKAKDSFNSLFSI